MNEIETSEATKVDSSMIGELMIEERMEFYVSICRLRKNPQCRKIDIFSLDTGHKVHTITYGDNPDLEEIAIEAEEEIQRELKRL